MRVITDPLADDLDCVTREWSEDRAFFSADQTAASLHNMRSMTFIFLGVATVVLAVYGGWPNLLTDPMQVVIGSAFWLLAVALVLAVALPSEWAGCPKTIEITDQSVTVCRRPLWGKHTTIYPAAHDLVVEWLIRHPSDSDGELTWHIELVGSHWRVPFGYDWSQEFQERFVELLRIQVGHTLREICPRCASTLSVREVNAANGRQHCSQCGWTSRGRQPPLLSTPQGDLLLPPLPAGPLRIQLATTDVLILHIGTRPSSWLVLIALLSVIGLSLMCCLSGPVAPAQQKPIQIKDIVAALWLLAILVGLVFCMVLYWQRHYRDTITLTAHRLRRELEIERNVSGASWPARFSMEGGGYITGSLSSALTSAGVDASSELVPEVYLMDGRTSRIDPVGARLRPLERRWLIVVLNRFLGTPQFCLPDGHPYPEACPVCGRTLSPKQIDTSSGRLSCVGFPDCLWNSAAGATDGPAVAILAQ